MKRTKQEAEQTRQDIIDAGLVVFGNKGVEEATINEIAEKAGVTRGAFYYHFKNKLTLYEHLLRLRAGYYRKIIDDSFKNDLPPILRIRKYMIDTLMKVATDDEFRAVNEMVFHKSAKIDEMLKSMKKTELERQIPTGIFRDTFAEGKKNGDVYSDASVDYATMTLFIFVQGAIIFRMLNRNYKLEEYAAGLVDSFLLGISERKSSSESSSINHVYK
ncbi:MAG: TetR family transcriptional regulator [Bacteroidia bacterium]|nr:TetR family transcriptional regulator [Bacteroidia bacterium]